MRATSRESMSAIASCGLCCVLLLAGCDRVFGLTDVMERTDASLDSAAACPDDYIAIPNTPIESRYRFSGTSFPWELAELDCENDGAPAITHLAVFDNALEMVALRDYLSMTNAGYFIAWVGYGRDLFTDPTSFFAVTGESVPDTQPPWNATEPNNGYGAGEEPVVWFDTSHDLVDGPADYSTSFLCECDHHAVTKQFQLH